MAKQESPGHSSWPLSAIAIFALLPGGNTLFCLGANQAQKIFSYRYYQTNGDVFKTPDILANLAFDALRLIAFAAIAYGQLIHPSEFFLVVESTMLAGASVFQTSNAFGQIDRHIATN